MAARRLAPLALLLVGCATAEPPRFTQPVPAVATPASPDRLAKADARLSKFRSRTVWPSDGDRETWTANLAAAEDLRRACEAEPSDERIAKLDGVLDMLAASDSVFRLGERMRDAR